MEVVWKVGGLISDSCSPFIVCVNAACSGVVSKSGKGQYTVNISPFTGCPWQRLAHHMPDNVPNLQPNDML